ncbi:MULTISPECIES: DUF488 domain-containing protein [Vibrio]|uniref:DUF488 domain-containing protein n=1 Tax=Vibrio splendidus TaxID=29497 RepID=A0A2N7JSH3_VIBSP|nr:MULTISPECIES: DUF488 domain-containing protein [Vibrio]PMF19647.1 hypothetical protein BCV19_12795 [Vibrio splendidus]PMM58231.1 hypothetical protein BCT54_21135 [Vibrio splendidus]PMO52480.1 hypothetical protein BCT08_21040 [Vibrio splendidus]TCV13508.1 uncharacterized protein DUF488 [Vibrio crassostreae]UQV21202.1 DUF488 domain-containing protein [Vibrio sp. J383]
MKIFTIGFTKKTAESFFSYLNSSDVKVLIDVRLNNTSQLSGFAKRDDLKFFLKTLCGADYVHMPELAPTKEILKPYQNKEITWDSYEDKFLNLMAQRNIEKQLPSSLLENGCLLCSEHEPHFCHRRLVVEYLNKTTNLNLDVKHLYK